MLRFCLMLLGWFLADLLFWRVGDARLRRIPAKTIWRILLGAFMVVQLIYIGNTFVRVFVDDLPDFVPLTLHVAAYLWHLLLLPVAILGVCIGGFWKAAGWLARKHPPRTQATAR